MTRSEAEERARRAFVRRYSASIMPLEVSFPEDRVVRVYDPETRSSLTYSCKGKRLFLLDEDRRH